MTQLQPYPAYKPSGLPWLGEVPEHWEACSLRTIATARNKRNRPDLPLLSVVREKGVILRSSMSVDENHNYVPDDLSNYKVVQAGDLVINKMKAWQGSLGIVPCDGIVSPAYYVFYFKIDNLSYGQYLLRSRPYIDFFARVSDGVRIGQWDLSLVGMRNIPVPLPPPAEQLAITCYLDHATRRIDRAIRAKRRLIALLQEQKQAIIHRAVTRGLDPNAKMKDSGVEWLGEVPEGWETPALKGLCKIQSGVTLGKDYYGHTLDEYPYLRVANVQTGRVDLREVKTIRIPAYEANRSLLTEGDVLMTEGGDPDKLGRGCVWDGQINPCLHQNHVFAVRPDKKRLLPQYLSALLSSNYAKNYFLLTSKQTTNLASTNKTTIGNFRIPLPAIDEQRTILKQLHIETGSVDQSISTTEHQISLLREYRTRLIADVVTGKVDVRAAAAQLPGEEKTIEDAIPEAFAENPEMEFGVDE